jgi:hypothetical protein
LLLAIAALGFPFASAGAQTGGQQPPPQRTSGGAADWLWPDMLGSVGQGMQDAVSTVGQVGSYVSRAASELSNILGLNQLETSPPQPAHAPPEAIASAKSAPGLGALGLGAPDLASRGAAASAASGSDQPRPAPPPVVIVTPRQVDTPQVAPKLGEGFVNDMPHKLPDGTLVVPKAAQRLYRLRTAPAALTSTPLTVQLDGIVMHDPSRGGQVQTSYLGHVEAGDIGVPYLGMEVVRGQILAWIRPTLTPLERATIRNDIARLTGDIVLAEKRIERLGQFFFVPFREGKIVFERLTLLSLQKQRDALLAVLTDREPIRAPISGRISAINHSIGQVAGARETIFEIVDPDALWVEAVAYTHGNLAEIVAASAATSDGTAIPLRYVGRGYDLRQHAIPLHFRIDARAPELSVGKPVRVVVQTAATEPGIILPNESVVRTASGNEIVWEKVGPEHFVARQVSTRPLDSTRLSIVDGLDPNTSVVTSSARLLSQFR